MILQQTRVDQGLGYWARFMEALPSVDALAQAHPDQVKGLWSGLGYYRRADLLHRGAKHIAAHGWPNGVKAWMEVPGVGPYTAAALASIVDQEVVPALDGNAYRVYSRLADWTEPIDSARSKAFIAAFAQPMIHPSRPGDFNQAVMDLAQRHCKPRNPQCSDCPCFDYCEARRVGQPDRVPVKRPKAAATELSLHFAVHRRGDLFGLVKRPTGGIWSGLYMLPELSVVPNGMAPEITEHKLSHRHLTLHFYPNAELTSEPEIWLNALDWRAQGMPQAFMHWLVKFAYI